MQKKEKLARLASSAEHQRGLGVEEWTEANKEGDGTSAIYNYVDEEGNIYSGAAAAEAAAAEAAVAEAVKLKRSVALVADVAKAKEAYHSNLAIHGQIGEYSGFGPLTASVPREFSSRRSSGWTKYWIKQGYKKTPYRYEEHQNNSIQIYTYLRRYIYIYIIYI